MPFKDPSKRKAYYRKYYKVWNKTPKGIASRKKYRQSEPFKELHRKQSTKYYYRHQEREQAQAREVGIRSTLRRELEADKTRISVPKGEVHRIAGHYAGDLQGAYSAKVIGYHEMPTAGHRQQAYGAFVPKNAKEPKGAYTIFVKYPHKGVWKKEHRRRTKSQVAHLKRRYPKGHSKAGQFMS